MRRLAFSVCLAATALGCGGTNSSRHFVVQASPTPGVGSMTPDASPVGSMPDAGGGVAPTMFGAGGERRRGGTPAVADAGRDVPSRDGGNAGADGAAGATCAFIGGQGSGGQTGTAPVAITPEPSPLLEACAAPPVLSAALQLAPIDPAQHYVRCGTYGPERGGIWRCHPGTVSSRTDGGRNRSVDRRPDLARDHPARVATRCTGRRRLFAGWPASGDALGGGGRGDSLEDGGRRPRAELGVAAGLRD